MYCKKCRAPILASKTAGQVTAVYCGGCGFVTIQITHDGVDIMMNLEHAWTVKGIIIVNQWDFVETA